ncbi:MAG: zinc-binding dehydrogenase [Lyngbya sp.]|nr:zinc-binding dehydrogenase [Lyngbya sp.]
MERVFPLSDIIEAHSYSETGRAVGKIVCVVESD